VSTLFLSVPTAKPYKLHQGSERLEGIAAARGEFKKGYDHDPVTQPGSESARSASAARTDAVFVLEIVLE
jgi:hypothetical protein